jgi:hypothetical protein
MQRVHISSGKSFCRPWRERVATNRLSTHIATEHPHSYRNDTSPMLARTRAAADERRGTKDVLRPPD